MENWCWRQKPKSFWRDIIWGLHKLSAWLCLVPLCCVARHATRPFRFATSLAPYGHYYSAALARFFVFFIYRSDLGEDTTICLQKPLLYDLSLDTQVVYSWNDGETTLDRSISEPGLYTLTTSIGECATSSSIQIEVEDCASQIYIPNSFSPNPI